MADCQLSSPSPVLSVLEERDKKRPSQDYMKDDKKAEITTKGKRRKTQEKISNDPILEQTLAQIAAFPNPSSQEALEELINKHFFPLPLFQQQNKYTFHQNQNHNLKIPPLPSPEKHTTHFDMSEFLISPILSHSEKVNKGLLDMTLAETSAFEDFERSCTGEMTKKNGELFSDKNRDYMEDVEFSRKMDGILGLIDEMDVDVDVDMDVKSKEEGKRGKREKGIEGEVRSERDRDKHKGIKKKDQDEGKAKEEGVIVLKWQKIESGETHKRKKSKST